MKVWLVIRDVHYEHSKVLSVHAQEPTARASAEFEAKREGGYTWDVKERTWYGHSSDITVEERDVQP